MDWDGTVTQASLVEGAPEGTSPQSRYTVRLDDGGGQYNLPPMPTGTFTEGDKITISALLKVASTTA